MSLTTTPGGGDRLFTLGELERLIAERGHAVADKSYTRSLLDAGEITDAIYRQIADAYQERAEHLAVDLAGLHVSADELRAEQQRRRANGDPRLLGIGMSVYVEITNGESEAEFGAVEITPEGDAILKTGSSSRRSRRSRSARI